MAKNKKIKPDLSDLLGSMDASIESVNPGHLFKPEEARREDSIGSGSRIIDCICGSPSQPGVLFAKRVTQLLAVEGAGKTTLFSMVAGQAQRQGKNVVFFDTEAKAFSIDHMERLGVDFSAKGSAGGDGEIGFFKIIKCNTVEEIDSHLMRFEENGMAEYIDVFLHDSIATALPQKALELGVGDSRQLGLHAVAIQKLYGKIRYMKEKYNWAVGFINQMRRAPQIGGMFQAKAVNVKGIGGSNDDTWTTTGGLALKHEIHQSIFMDLYKVEKNDAGEIIKQYVKFTTTKNMVGSTGRKVFVKLVANKGFDDEETLIESMQEWGFIEHVSAGNYDVYAEDSEDAEPVIRVKGIDNVLSAIKKQPGLLDKLYNLYFELSEAAIDEDESDLEDEIEVD